jgi:hypothetical protein
VTDPDVADERHPTALLPPLAESTPSRDGFGGDGDVCEPRIVASSEAIVRIYGRHLPPNPGRTVASIPGQASLTDVLRVNVAVMDT